MTLNYDTDKKTLFNVKSLREQVYEYLRGEMQTGRLIPGSLMNLNEISKQLGISKTPLQDALIQLECEGFVTFLPRRGVLMKKLTLDSIKNVIEIVGALESAVIMSVFDKIMPNHLDEMAQLNAKMRTIMQDRQTDSFDQRYYQLNIAFHDVFLNLSGNKPLQQIVIPIKQRLYDFPRPTYIKEWELINCDEHDQLIQFIKDGKPKEAARLWRDNHWSFTAHERFIREFYAQGNKQIRNALKGGN